MYLNSSVRSHSGVAPSLVRNVGVDDYEPRLGTVNSTDSPRASTGLPRRGVVCSFIACLDHLTSDTHPFRDGQGGGMFFLMEGGDSQTACRMNRRTIKYSRFQENDGWGNESEQGWDDDFNSFEW